MKIPEKAPNWEQIFKKDPAKILKLTHSEAISELIKKVNTEYYYWDKFKYVDFSKHASIEEAWASLKIKRQSASSPSPIKDKKGKNFTYWIPDIVLKELSFIDKNTAGDILVEEPEITNPQLKEKFIINSIMEEAIASSQLEGAATTRKKAKAMLRSGGKPKNHAEQMCLNNYQTIMWVKEIINEHLSPQIIKEIQRRITQDTLEDQSNYGKFQTEDEERVVVVYQGETVHIPPPAKDIEKHIQDLCDFANKPDKDGDFLHPVIKAIFLHFWLAYIHPFEDGNGRTARVLFYWYLLKNNYWLFEYLSISRIVLKAPSQYVRAYIYTEIDDLDLTYFITFHLRTIRLAFQDLKKYLKKKQKEIKEINNLELIINGLNSRQANLLRHALKHGQNVYTIKEHKNIYNIVYQTARMDLFNLEKKGFLKRKKRGAEFCFIPIPSLYEKLKKEQTS